MASDAVRSGAVVLLLFTLFFESLFCYALLYVLSNFATISLVKRELVALLLLSSRCHVAVIFLCLFFTVCREMVCSV